jgi:hypothetical protein
MTQRRTNRVVTLDAAITLLYREVECLEARCKPMQRHKNDPWYFMPDLESRTLREQARALHKERSNLLGLGLH